MRRTLSATDANNHLADALRQAEAGDLVLITRYRKPVAALVGGERLERLQRLEDAPGEESAGSGTADGFAAETGASVSARSPAAPEGLPPEASTLVELRDRAAAGCLRRIEADLARVPETLRPALRLIRANLFHPRLTVERLQAALQVGAHDYTTEFRRAAGVSIHRYFTNRRLEAAARLLLDTELRVQAIGLLVGYSGSEALSRAFKTRYGVRPPVYREFEGNLSPAVASDAGADRPPLLPRYLAGMAAVAEGTVCGRCGDALEAQATLRVFEDLAPICSRCARQRSPELVAIQGIARPADAGPFGR
jgi:prevent-host-death family protein